MSTSFDRWLIRRFTVETHIFTLSDPGPLPGKAKRVELGNRPGTKYRYQFITKDERVADQIISHLRANQHSFNTQLKQRTNLLARMVKPDDGRSFTFAMISRLFVLIALIGVVYLGYLAIYEHRFDEEIDAVIEFFTGGPKSFKTAPPPEEPMKFNRPGY